MHVGATVAPNHKRIATYVLAATGLVAAGFLLFPAVVVRDYWAMWRGICTAVGVALAAYSISSSTKADQ